MYVQKFLQQALMQIGSAVYAHANASASTANPGTQYNAGGSSDDVINADFLP